jgi:2,4'-dihydroxyacetophenone dioxygenase
MLYEQVDTAVIDGESLPWVPFTPYADNVFLKYFKFHHSGTVMVYTIEGQWKYKEHNWVAGPGSLVFETAASSHTPEVVSTGGSDKYVLTLVSFMGDLVFVDENDKVLAIENWKTGMQRYLAFCESHGIKPKDLSAFN